MLDITKLCCARTDTDMFYHQHNVDTFVADNNKMDNYAQCLLCQGHHVNNTQIRKVKPTTHYTCGYVRTRTVHVMCYLILHIMSLSYIQMK